MVVPSAEAAERSGNNPNSPFLEIVFPGGRFSEEGGTGFPREVCEGIRSTKVHRMGE